MSPYERLRLSGTLRSTIIAWGIGALTLLLARNGAGASEVAAPAQALYIVLTGLALQVLLLVVRRLTARYEQSRGLEGFLSPLVVFLFELVADAVSVFLFALGTYQGILQFANMI